MTRHCSSSIAWSWLALCCCHMLFAAEADQRYTASSSSSSGFESLLAKAHLAHNASSTSKAALLSLFAKYGKNGTLSFEGFEHLLESLGLWNVAVSGHNASEAHRSVRGSWSVELHAAADDHSETDPHHDHHAHDHDHHDHDHDHHAHHDDDKTEGGADDVHNDIEAHDHHASSAVCVNCLSSKVP